MLVPRVTPDRYRAWNRKWNAPYGPSWLVHGPEKLRTIKAVVRYLGPFVFQPNNSTRRFEYPWAYYAAGLTPGGSVLEIGGGLSGFQFACAKAGVNYRNVDPFVDYGSSEAYGAGFEAVFSSLNHAFKTNVSLIKSPCMKRNLLREASIWRIRSR
jgi:hypothetical protein